MVLQYFFITGRQKIMRARVGASVSVQPKSPHYPRPQAHRAPTPGPQLPTRFKQNQKREGFS